MLLPGEACGIGDEDASDEYSRMTRCQLTESIWTGSTMGGG
jgi:hypothetical protein